jgi:hypothetical protein
MRSFIAIFVALLSSHAQAEVPWGKVELSQGKSLHEKDCTACHRRMYGGDGSKMYSRDGRMLSNKLELLQRVASCNSSVSSGWFPEEEGAVAAWLNQEYYHFKE